MRVRENIARVLIGLVLFFNLQCALVFLFNPAGYAPAFELSGAAGNAMVQGMGLLFVMWNVPYAAAFSSPVRRRVSLIEAVIMQAIGFAGEGVLLMLLPAGHAVLRESVARFLWFDGAGLLALLAAWVLLSVKVGRVDDDRPKPDK